LEKVVEKRDAEYAIGYSAAGVVVEVGADIKDLAPLDGVASAGGEYADHAEFSRGELIAIFSFSVSVIAVNLVGLTIACVEIAWFFWFCVAVLVKRWGILRVSMKTGEKPW
jgi:NADPH:quinone reductase-like Zn-dependent oxidoreductase